MHEQQIDQIKNALREMIQMIIARGQPLSEEMKIALAQAMEHAAERITQLRREQQGQEEEPTLPPLPEIEAEQAAVANEITPPEEPTPQAPNEPIPPLDDAPYPSSNIRAFKYSPKDGRLLVKFMGKDTKNSGPTYLYNGVGKNVFDLIARGGVGPKTSGANKYHRWHRNVLPSHGAAVNALLVKGQYPYRKIA